MSDPNICVVSGSLTVQVPGFGCFYKLGVPFVGVLVIRALLFGIYAGAPSFWKLQFPGLPEFGCHAFVRRLALDGIKDALATAHTLSRMA